MSRLSSAWSGARTIMMNRSDRASALSTRPPSQSLHGVDDDQQHDPDRRDRHGDDDDRAPHAAVVATLLVDGGEAADGPIEAQQADRRPDGDDRQRDRERAVVALRQVLDDEDLGDEVEGQADDPAAQEQPEPRIWRTFAACPSRGGGSRASRASSSPVLSEIDATGTPSFAGVAASRRAGRARACPPRRSGQAGRLRPYTGCQPSRRRTSGAQRRRPSSRGPRRTHGRRPHMRHP